MRSEKDKVVLELVNLMDTWTSSIAESHDLFLSDIADMNEYLNKLINTFDLAKQGELEDDIVSYKHYLPYVYEEDPISFSSLKKTYTNEDN